MTTAETDLVVVGVVKEVSPAKWATHHGKAPPVGGSPKPEELYIYRVATVEVRHVLSGVLCGRSVPVAVYGGVAEEVSMVDAGEAELVPGERVVLFLIRPNPAAGHVPRDAWHRLLGYRLDGGTARTEFQAPLPVSELAGRVRAAATLKADS